MDVGLSLVYVNSTQNKKNDYYDMMKLSYLEELTAHWPTQAALRMVLGFIYQYLNGDCHAEFTQWEDLRRQHVKCLSLSFSNMREHILFIIWTPLV